MKKIAVFFAGLLVSQMVCAGMDKTEAENLVKNAQCADGMTIDEALAKKIKSRSQRDLGWKVFDSDNDELDVVRIILINKGMRVNYSWRVGNGGGIKPVTKRAKKLCGI